MAIGRLLFWTNTRPAVYYSRDLLSQSYALMRQLNKNPEQKRGFANETPARPSIPSVVCLHPSLARGPVLFAGPLVMLRDLWVVIGPRGRICMAMAIMAMIVLVLL